VPVIGVGSAGYGFQSPIAGPMIVVGAAYAAPGFVQVSFETPTVVGAWEAPTVQAGYEV
jgi:hypothetical protein